MPIPFAQRLSERLLTGPTSREAMQRAMERQREESEAYRRGDITQTELGLRTAGNIADASVGNIVGQLVEPVMPIVETAMDAGAGVLDYMVPDAIPEALARSETLAPAFEAVRGVVENPRVRRNAEALLSASDLALVGGGTAAARRAGSRVDDLTGEESGRGMLTASANNFIPGYYTTDPLKKAVSVAKWLPKQVYSTARDLVSPTSRATYREAGVSKTTQKIMAEATARDSVFDVLQKVPYLGKLFEPEEKELGPHRAVAQGQYTARTAAQSDRRGRTLPQLQEIMRRSDLVEVSEYYPGSYTETVKSNKLVPYYRTEGAKKQMPVRLSDDDFAFIEEHFSTVWTEPSRSNLSVNVPFKEDTNTLLAIKSPGAGQKITGSHFNDVLSRSAASRQVESIFKGVKKVDPEELYVKLRAAADQSQDLKEPQRKFKVAGQAEDGGVWITGSMPGQAITEGGINYLIKVTPDGKMIGVMSDEHNLFEGFAAKTEKYTAGAIPALSLLKHFLPNRLVAVTPPMVMDISSKAAPTRKYQQPQGKSDDTPYLSLIDDIIDYKPSQEVLEAERSRNRGVAAAGVGLASMGSRQEDEEE